MRKIRSSVAIIALIPLLTASSCEHISGDGAGKTSQRKVLSPVTGPITSTCTPGGDVGGYMRIVLPKRLAFRDAAGADPAIPARKVFSHRRGPGEPVSDGPDNEEKAGATEEDNNPTQKEPFHIYLKNANLNPSGKRYVAVKIVIPKDADYAFYPELQRDSDVDPSFFAVGYGLGSSQLLAGHLCFNGTSIRKVPAAGDPRPRRIFRFYIDTQGLDQSAGYLGSINILLQPYTSPETMIIVDPKVRNDG